MKKVFLIVFVILFSATLSILIKRYLDDFFHPEISFFQKTHDFDTLYTENAAEVYFVYQNLGKKDLRIYDIQSSCGCTVPSWNESFLEPYRKDSFKVTYNIENKGYFIKEIMVYSNSDTSPDRLEILGFVPFD